MRGSSFWGIVRKAQDIVLATAKPGVPAEAVDAASRKVITDAGYGPDDNYFTHRLGHGIGMEEHEWHYLVRGSKRPLEPGNMFPVLSIRAVSTSNVSCELIGYTHHLFGRAPLCESPPLPARTYPMYHRARSTLRSPAVGPLVRLPYFVPIPFIFLSRSNSCSVRKFSHPLWSKSS